MRHRSPWSSTTGRRHAERGGRGRRSRRRGGTRVYKKTRSEEEEEGRAGDEGKTGGGRQTKEEKGPDDRKWDGTRPHTWPKTPGEEWLERGDQRRSKFYGSVCISPALADGWTRSVRLAESRPLAARLVSQPWAVISRPVVTRDTHTPPRCVYSHPCPPTQARSCFHSTRSTRSSCFVDPCLALSISSFML